ncbi:SigE family RNA polymerase sigma factor [Catellatospora bangladeshensis]|uniref:RNA polymerase sigma24 factor n=1 Tax=Catellatospora bangladeshensis TaxID=310355 RepID=A0A8J3JPW5_9ACTN|nr:SigE family RNA polymerase sigma factor [Catellatospora bangladeshensis]GIF82623.1 RNA polymerase sigma24 factor [Catellatospora bangladeshensis]
MKAVDEGEYRQFAGARMEQLRRTAFLLCRDWHQADDLVAITLGKLYRNWGRARRADNVEAYVRGILMNAFLDETRRPWRREEPAEQLPEAAGPQDIDTVDTRADLLALLDKLGPGRRAVVVLRFYCDLSVQDTAAILNISEGAVKSQAARGLHTLRLLADPDPATDRRESR